MTDADTRQKQEEEKAMENIPEFIEGGPMTEYEQMQAHYNRIQQKEYAKEHGRHGAEMFAAGIVEGMRQAIHAIETNRQEVQPLQKWAGMNAAIAAIEKAIGAAQEATQGGD
jgi:hypothetical protein